MHPNKDNIEKAKIFLLSKWRERRLEMSGPEAELPHDLSSACKFASMFAQAIFGGHLQGNWHHQYVVLPSGMLIDLCEDGVVVQNWLLNNHPVYQHDREFFGNPDHEASMRSCQSRVDRWVGEFLAHHNVPEAPRAGG